MTEEEITRFWSKVDRNGPVVRLELGNCWIWTASKRSGYGAFAIKRKAKQAHRISYELEYSEAPYLLRHKCDNRACVRPSHLEPGGHKENTQDMLERNPRKGYLSVEAVTKARSMAREGYSIVAIREEVGGDRTSLLRAIQGYSHPHVTEPVVALEDIYRPIFSKLTEEQYEEIMTALKKPYHGQGKALAKKYGVDPSMITLIKKGKVKSVRDVS